MWGEAHKQTRCLFPFLLWLPPFLLSLLVVIPSMRRIHSSLCVCVFVRVGLCAPFPSLSLSPFLLLLSLEQGS